MSAISFQELDQMAGEMLPERTLLSTVTDFGGGSDGGAGGGSASSAAAAGGGSVVAPADHGATAISACQSTNTPGTPGLLGSLGLGSANPSAAQTCTPAAIASH